MVHFEVEEGRGGVADGVRMLNRHLILLVQIWLVVYLLVRVETHAHHHHLLRGAALSVVGVVPVAAGGGLLGGERLHGCRGRHLLALFLVVFLQQPQDFLLRVRKISF